MSEHEHCIADRIGFYITDTIEKIKAKTLTDGWFKMTLIDRTNKDYFKNEFYEDCDKLKAQSLEYYKQLRGDLILNGKSPRGVAAGILYISSIVAEMPITQQEIADLIGVSNAGLRRYYRLLGRYFNLFSKGNWKRGDIW